MDGWCDNVFALNGLVTAGAVGLAHVQLVTDEYKVDIICADMVSNSTMAVAWHTFQNRYVMSINWGIL